MKKFKVKNLKLTGYNLDNHTERLKQTLTLKKMGKKW